MAEAEEYFPRGGKKPVAANFFKQNVNFLGAAQKSAKKKKRTKKSTEGDDGYLSDEVSKDIKNIQEYCAPGITFKTIKEGQLMLGRVNTVTDTKINVMLPSKVHATVMACHISEPYNKQLEAYVNDQIDNVRELHAMFRTGQYLAVKVLEAEKDQVMLSMMPQHVNGGKTNADLVKGVIIQAAVSSVEDHGYVMDIGVPNTRAFLPKKSANPDIDLDVGCITWCCVSSASPSSETSIVTLASDLESLNKALLKRKTNTPLLPATPVLFTVDKPVENGIEGRVFGDTTAYIKRNHTASVKGKKPGLGQKLKAYLLYVMPTRQTPFFTMKNIFETTYPDMNEEQKYKAGDFVEDAQVLKITGRSVIFRLSPGSFGSMALRRLQVSEDLSDEQIIAKSYPVGSTHKVRILNYNLSDFLYSVSDDISVINEKYFSIHDLKVGDLVEGVVKSVADNQLKVSVGRINGMVPHAHMSDAGFYVDPKKRSLSKLPKKKFKEGKEVKARILSIDTNKNLLVLTLKTSLVNLPPEEILADYSDALVGKAYTGVIKFIRNEYILVSFFNHVTAYVPRNYVTKDDVDNVSDVFHLGQIVTCTIIKADVEGKKMVGSLTTTPFWPNKKREIPVKRKQNEQTKEQQPVPNKKRKASESDDSAKIETNGKLAKSDAQTSKKKNKESKESDTANDIEVSKAKKDNKFKQAEESCDEVKSNKNKQRKSSENDNTNDQETDAPKTSKKKKKKTKSTEVLAKEKVDEDIKQSEESDAIETDVYEDDTVLTPRDQGLVDLSDCDTLELYKKRIHVLKKSIEGKHQRIIKINAKIKNLETRGLTPRNKKFHTAMHSEKLILQQSIELIEKALKLAQEKSKQFQVTKNRNDSQTESSNEEKNSKRKKEKTNADGLNNSMLVIDSIKPVLDVPSVKEFWILKDNKSEEKPQEESSSSEDESEEQPKKKRKKLSVAEKLAKVRAEEERVRELEARAASNDNEPRSCEQFERALLASPDCSQLWIAYMAFHLQSTEVDKARAVGARALSTISFREEGERLNVWLARLNMEIRFGTKESQQKTLEEALQMNEPFSIHSKLLDIYLETGQHQELSTLVDLMMRKYKRQVDSYVACGSVCYKAGMVDKARQVMQKAISVLDKKEHVSMLVQFALLERTHGSQERAEAIFEQITNVYPKRVDVTCAYADMLVKCQDIERVRQLMERMTSQKLPARKMKILYKKWIEVEEKLGDKGQAEIIRQRAIDFIEKAKF